MPVPFEPKKFGRYQLVELLATGGMAEIFKAKTAGAHGFEKTLVIKRILPYLAADSEFVEMFVDEAKLMVQLNHPKIVQVIDFGEVEGQYFMALEYVDGLDCLELLRCCARRRCRPTTGIALQIVADVLDALDYAHGLRGPDGAKLGVVHRDISPSNIFISWVGEVKLGDFGIARAAFRRDRESGALKGKYGYMAPEQATGSEVDARADVFSVGVVLAELLMIRRLFYARNDIEVLLQVRDARLDRLDKYGARIPADLRAVIESALARDPNMRYQSAAVFRDALFRYLFDHRRMVRSTDVRKFLLRLTEDDAPLQQAPRRDTPDSLPAGLPREGAEVVTPLPATADPVAGKQPRGDVALFEGGIISVGRKRRIVITPPPTPLPVPVGLPQTGDEPRITTEDALAAVPEMEACDQSSSHFDLDRDVPSVAPEPAPGRFPSASRSAPLPLSRPPPERGTPRLAGEIRKMRLFELFLQLAVQEETGLLVVSLGDVTKEIFLRDGDPHYVTSNRADELFGQYLVARRALSEGELSMALAMLPHFDGRLGDALVGLKLMRPVQVLRHLTSQVREKLLDIFTWESGEYRFYTGETCSQESAPLGLDAFEIIGAAIRLVAPRRLERELEDLLPVRLRAVSPTVVPPEVFRLGALPRRVYDKLDGRHTVGELLSPFDDLEQRLEFVRVLVLLVSSGMATA